MPYECYGSMVGLEVNISHFPWNTNKEFQEVIAQIGDRTLVDPYRLYELWTLSQQVAKLSKGDYIEIGVWQGGSGALIAHQAAKYLPDSTVFLCDTFTGVPKATARDLYVGGEHANTSKAMVENLVSSMNLANVQVLQGIFPEDTGSIVKDRTFRFAHIDVDVYQSAKDCNEWLWPRLCHGGVVVYDDYGHVPCGLTEYVDEQSVEPDRITLYNLNGHAVVFKL